MSAGTPSKRQSDSIERFRQCDPGPARLGNSEIHVWRAEVRAPPERIRTLYSLLSDEERQRHDSFRVERERESFCVCRGYLRMLLSRYGCGEARSINLRIGEYGKPAVDDHNISFNLSHSGDLALFALSTGRQLGVDVQQELAEPDIEEISRRFFSEEESRSILSNPSETRAAAFYACWTRKEAAIKAIGGSIARHLKEVVVSTEPRAPAELVAMPPEERGKGWHLEDLPIDAGYRASLCYSGPEASLSLWRDDAR